MKGQILSDDDGLNVGKGHLSYEKGCNDNSFSPLISVIDFYVFVEGIP